MIKDIFENLHLFDDIEADHLAKIKPLFCACQYQNGQTIFERGDRADSLYIVVDGQVDIRFDPHDGELLTVATIKKDGVFGWSAAFGNDAYTSGAVCVADAKLLRVQGDELKDFHKNYPKTCILVLNRLAQVVAERLKRSHMHSKVVAMLEHGLKNDTKPFGGT